MKGLQHFGFAVMGFRVQGEVAQVLVRQGYCSHPYMGALVVAMGAHENGSRLGF